MPTYAYVLIGIAALIVLLVVIVSLRPSAFAISRSATMAAPPEVVFPHVNNFHLWEAWSPWAKLDPTSKTTFEGPAAGEGAVMTWDGNKKVGAGRMTITASEPGKLIRIRLEFFRPMKAVNPTEFAFEQDGGGTRVTWTMTGTNGFVGKLFFLLMSIDKMVGKDFEKGLASIKGIVEGGGPARAAA